jgi:hypothetical protein
VSPGCSCSWHPLHHPSLRHYALTLLAPLPTWPVTSKAPPTQYPLGLLLSQMPGQQDSLQQGAAGMVVAVQVQAMHPLSSTPHRVQGPASGTLGPRQGLAVLSSCPPCSTGPRMGAPRSSTAAVRAGWLHQGSGDQVRAQVGGLGISA